MGMQLPATLVNNPSLRPDTIPKQTFPVPRQNLITLVEACWVCRRVFPDYGGDDGVLVQEFHHPVPEAYGGTTGPVISICSGHHSATHDLALRLLSNRPYDDLIGHEPAANQQRLLHLANIIKRAKETFDTDPNRRMGFGASLPKILHDQLKLAARSRRQSVEGLVESVIVDFLNREFPRRRKL